MTATELPDRKIVDFINEHHVLTLATSHENKPYCASCFYVYMDDENAFVFASDTDTKHIRDAIHNNYVAGSVYLETKIVGKIRGIQFNGFLSEATGEKGKRAIKAYYKKFPYAKLMKATYWILELTFIKLTDNRLGFGKKIIWEKKATI